MTTEEQLADLKDRIERLAAQFEQRRDAAIDQVGRFRAALKDENRSNDLPSSQEVSEGAGGSPGGAKQPWEDDCDYCDNGKNLAPGQCGACLRRNDRAPLVMGPGSGGQLRDAQEWALTLRGSMTDSERKGRRFVVNDDPRASEPTAYVADTVTGNVVSSPYRQSDHGSGFKDVAEAEANRRNTLEADPSYNPLAATRVNHPEATTSDAGEPEATDQHTAELDADNPDGRHWAQAFIEHFSGFVVGAPTVDESLLIAWFANAIESGRRYATNHPSPEDGGWQPIETAPIDRLIRVKNDEHGWEYDARWNPDEAAFFGAGLDLYGATHWRPISVPWQLNGAWIVRSDDGDSFYVGPDAGALVDRLNNGTTLGRPPAPLPADSEGGV